MKLITFKIQSKTVAVKILLSNSCRGSFVIYTYIELESKGSFECVLSGIFEKTRVLRKVPILGMPTPVNCKGSIEKQSRGL